MDGQSQSTISAAPVYGQPVADQQPPVVEQPIQPGQPVQLAQSAPASAPSDDPLARLMGLVQGGDGASSLAGLNVKELFVVTKSKLSNSFLRRLVDSYREEGLTDSQIVTMLVELDEKVEKGEITAALFESYKQENQ